MCSGKYGSCLDETTDVNGSMDIYNPGPSDNTQDGDTSSSNPSWTAPGAHRYIGIIIVVVLAFIALLCWMFFARWPRQQIRRLFSNRSSLHHSSSSSTTTIEAGDGRGRSEEELELEKGRGAERTKGRDRKMGGSKTEILEVEESQWRSSKMTVQLPEKPTPCAHKKPRTYGLDWIKRQTSSPRTPSS